MNILPYLALIAILLLAGFAGLITLLRWLRPNFAFSWLLAAVASLVAWPLLLIARPAGPRFLPLFNWQPQSLFFSSPELLIDGVSWPFALALATLVLSMVLTEVARAAESDWSAWAGSLILTAIGLLAVFAGNPLTLMMAWVAVDGIELAILLWHLPSSRGREQAVIAFSARSAGVFLLWLAMVAAEPAGSGFTFGAIPQNVSAILVLAAGLRLGVIPLHLPSLHEFALRRGLGTILRLVPAASGLMLLGRTAAVGVPAEMSGILLALVGMAAFISAFSWTIAADELEGRPFWLLGTASLALAGALRAQPAASIAWGIAMLLSGSVLFFMTARHSNLFLITLLGLIGFTGLPFTPAWNGLTIYAGSFSIWLVFFLLAHALLLAGFVRHALRPGESLEGVERWVWVIYPIGLIWLPVGHYLIAGWGGSLNGGSIFYFSWLQLIPGVTALALMVLFWRLHTGRPRWIAAAGRILAPPISLGWLYRMVGWLDRIFGRLVRFISQVLEGRGGVLWAILLLALLVAFLVQTGVGGL